MELTILTQNLSSLTTDLTAEVNHLQKLKVRSVADVEAVGKHIAKSSPAGKLIAKANEIRIEFTSQLDAIKKAAMNAEAEFCKPLQEQIDRLKKEQADALAAEAKRVAKEKAAAKAHADLIASIPDYLIGAYAPYNENLVKGIELEAMLKRAEGVTPKLPAKYEAIADLYMDKATKYHNDFVEALKRRIEGKEAKALKVDVAVESLNAAVMQPVAVHVKNQRRSYKAKAVGKVDWNAVMQLMPTSVQLEVLAKLKGPVAIEGIEWEEVVTLVNKL